MARCKGTCGRTSAGGEGALWGHQVFRAERGKRKKNTQRLHYKMEDFPRFLIKRGGNGASPEASVPLIKCWEVIRNCYCTADKAQ